VFLKNIMAVKLLVCNYHYIRDVIPRRGIHPITPSFFEDQLDLIHSNGYEFISLHSLNENIKNSNSENLPKKSCLITFDDGLRESYDIGFSIMSKKGIPGAFFIISDAIHNRKLLDVHKIHYLRSVISDEDILNYFPSLGCNEFSQLDDSVFLSVYHYDDYRAAKVKYILNFSKRAFVDMLFDHFISDDEGKLAEDLYMTKEQMLDLHSLGFLGTHSDQHLPLATLSKDDIYNDIKCSIQKIENSFGGIVDSISYPYGDSSSVSDDVISACSDVGLTSGFTMTRGINDFNDIIRSPFMIKRMDTNDIFNGRHASTYDEL